MSITEAQRVFSDIYARNVWGKGSGVGSEPAYTKPYVAMFQSFLLKEQIKSVVDIGCGDWQFSQLIDWSGIEYDGFDVAEKVISENKRNFSARNIRFHHIRNGASIPRADLVVCKDVLQHLPTRDVEAYLAIFKQLFPRILITNDIAPERGFNTDIGYGQWRALKLDQPPFCETFEETLRWDVDAYGCQWTKQTCLIRNAPEAGLNRIQLQSRERSFGETVNTIGRKAWYGFKVGIVNTPVVGTLAKTIKRAFRSS